MNFDTKLCKDLLAIPLQNGVLDLSWELDTDTIKSLLISEDIEKVINFYDNVDFLIEIDTKDTFDTINKKQYKFSEIEQTYKGKIVFSAVIPFNKNKFEETSYYFRVKFIPNSDYNVIQNNIQGLEDIEFNDSWSDSLLFTIPKNYTKDIVEQMYNIVADFNSYNKEAKSANFYYLFQAFADTLNTQFSFATDIENSNFINKSKPDYLLNVFGQLLKFTNVDNLSMEEYRRVLRNLVIGYQNGGAWNYIAGTIKYFIGHTPTLVDFKNFYPWILRKAKIIGYKDGNMNEPIYEHLPDPINFKDRNYNNPNTNYYLFKKDFDKNKDRNQIMLLSDYYKKFTFIVKCDNYFNTEIDKEKISNILDILKSVYTKYIINIEEVVSEVDLDNVIFVDEEKVLLADDNTLLQF